MPIVRDRFVTSVACLLCSRVKSTSFFSTSATAAAKAANVPIVTSVCVSILSIPLRVLVISFGRLMPNLPPISLSASPRSWVFSSALLSSCPKFSTASLLSSSARFCFSRAASVSFTALAMRMVRASFSPYASVSFFNRSCCSSCFFVNSPTILLRFLFVAVNASRLSSLPLNCSCSLLLSALSIFRLPFMLPSACLYSFSPYAINRVLTFGIALYSQIFCKAYGLFSLFFLAYLFIRCQYFCYAVWRCSCPKITLG